jgi:tetratricopeptide (TPR) repeat protein
MKKNVRLKKPIAFFAGAGVCVNAPSHLPHAHTINKRIFDLIAASDSVRKQLYGFIEKNPPTLRFETIIEAINRNTDKKLGVLSFLNKDSPPNSIHYAIANMAIHHGAIIITTNFDSLFEQAINELGGKAYTICEPADFKQFKRWISAGKIPVIKLHGSFRKYNGSSFTDASHTIQAELNRVGANNADLLLESYKLSLFGRIIANHHLIVAGYSGSDDFDIMPSLLQMKFTKVTWLQHQLNIEERNITASVLADINQKKITELNNTEKLFSKLSKTNAYEFMIAGQDTMSFFRNQFPVKKMFVHAHLTIDILHAETTTWASAHVSSDYMKFFLSGAILLEAEKFKDAQVLFAKNSQSKKLLALNVELAVISSYNAALCLIRTGKIQMALQIFERIRKVHFKDSRLSNKTRNETLSRYVFALYNANQFAKALRIGEKLLQSTITVQQRLETKNHLAFIYQEQGMTAKAVSSYNAALRIAIRSGDFKQQGWIYYNLGTLYYELGDIQQSKDLMNKAVDRAKMVNDVNHLSNCLLLQSQLDLFEGKIASALTALEQSIQNNRDIGALENHMLHVQQLGIVLMEDKKYQPALYHFKQAFKVFKKHGSVNGANTAALIAEWYVRQNKPGTAVDWILKAKNILGSNIYPLYSLRIKFLEALINYLITPKQPVINKCVMVVRQTIDAGFLTLAVDQVVLLKDLNLEWLGQLPPKYRRKIYAVMRRCEDEDRLMLLKEQNSWFKYGINHTKTFSTMNAHYYTIYFPRI